MFLKYKIESDTPNVQIKNQTKTQAHYKVHITIPVKFLKDHMDFHHSSQPSPKINYVQL